MSALSDAARNVEWAAATLRRELENPTEWVSGKHGCDDRESKRLVDNLIAAVRAHDAALAHAEALHDNTGTDADEAYQQAIGDVVGAITAQIGETT